MNSETKNTFVELIIDEMREMDDFGIVDNYARMGTLESSVGKAIDSFEKFLGDRFSSISDLHTYLSCLGSPYSFELIFGIRGIINYSEYGTYLELLQLLTDDNFTYMFACDLLGYGRGWFELFEGTPCLNYLV